MSAYTSIFRYTTAFDQSLDQDEFDLLEDEFFIFKFATQKDNGVIQKFEFCIDKKIIRRLPVGGVNALIFSQRKTPNPKTNSSPKKEGSVKTDLRPQSILKQPKMQDQRSQEKPQASSSSSPLPPKGRKGKKGTQVQPSEQGPSEVNPSEMKENKKGPQVQPTEQGPSEVNPPEMKGNRKETRVAPPPKKTEPRQPSPSGKLPKKKSEPQTPLPEVTTQTQAFLGVVPPSSMGPQIPNGYPTPSFPVTRGPATNPAQFAQMATVGMYRPDNWDILQKIWFTNPDGTLKSHKDIFNAVTSFAPTVNGYRINEARYFSGLLHSRFDNDFALLTCKPYVVSIADKKDNVYVFKHKGYPASNGRDAVERFDLSLFMAMNKVVDMIVLDPSKYESIKSLYPIIIRYFEQCDKSKEEKDGFTFKFNYITRFLYIIKMVKEEIDRSSPQ